MTLDAFIFDLDGTLVDTELLWVEAMGAYLSDQGCKCAKETLLHIVFGRSWTDIYRDLVARFPALSDFSAPAMAEALRAYYLRLREQGDGVVILLAFVVLILVALLGKLDVWERIRV